MEPKTKQYLLVTVVGVTLFVALLRLSAVLAFAAKLIDLVLHPGTFHQRAHDRAGKAAEKPVPQGEKAAIG